MSSILAVGQGAWLSVWRKTGASVVGVDGPYVQQRDLMINAEEFRTRYTGRENGHAFFALRYLDALRGV